MIYVDGLGCISDTFLTDISLVPSPSAFHRIGWSYRSITPTTIEEYELAKKRPRTKRQLYIPAMRRRDVLIQDWNVDEDELRRVRKENQYIQYQRGKSAGISSRRASRKPSVDKSDTSQPSLRREITERVTRYSPTPELQRARSFS